MTEVIDEAEVAIVGGGILGCSIAYHLCRRGIADVILVERAELATQATARAAGLVLHGASDRNAVRMVRRTRAAMAELADEFGEDPGFRPVGSLGLVQAQERVADVLAAAALLRDEGVSVEQLDPQAARALCPWLEPADAALITFAPDDGYVDGARLAMSYLRAARRLGARTRRGAGVEGFARTGDRVTGVVTSAGVIRAGTVVVAAGAWSVALLHGLGWGMPATPVRSHYWITAPDGTGAPERPNVLLPDFGTYLRPEVGGMVLGFQEPRSQTFDPFTLPESMEAALRHDQEAETDLLIEHAASLATVIPGLSDWRFAHHIAGLSMYTPDGKILLGPVPGIGGLYLAGGCCGSGIAMSGGIGAATAGLVAGRATDIDPTPFDPARFGTVDPGSHSFRALCAAARSRKSRGRQATSTSV
ncbi:MAG TPA: FAD-binding oxidoreductase [Alphaproteobacteria bacterium]